MSTPSAEPVVEQTDETTEVEEVAADEVEEFVPPTKEEYEELQTKLQKANDEAKKYRLRAKEKAAVATELDQESAKQVEEVWKNRFLNQAASLAFAREGVEASSRLLKLLDFSELDVTEDGDVEGLSEQIDELKNSFPQLFVVKPVKKASKTDLGRTGAPQKKQTADLFADAFKDVF